MMAEPVRVPTSGMIEKNRAITASTAVKGAPMIERKMKLSTPFVSPRLELAHDEIPDGVGDLFGEIDESPARRLAGTNL